jgi:hypothetical protein
MHVLNKTLLSDVVGDFRDFGMFLGVPSGVYLSWGKRLIHNIVLQVLYPSDIHALKR